MLFKHLSPRFPWSRTHAPIPNAVVKALPEPSEQLIRLLADPDVSLSALCQFVDSDINPIIYEAQILESCVYIQRHNLVSPHRRIVLKIRERRGKYFWLLLERMPTSRKALVKGLGITPAHDLVSKRQISIHCPH